MRIFLARDPGGANVIAPLFRACPGPKELWAKDYARATFAREGLLFRDFNAGAADRPFGPGDLPAAAAWLAARRGATLLVTGTSNLDDCAERMAWEAAAGRGLPSIAVIDQWVRPLERFRWEGALHRPDHVVALSDEAADRLRAAGCARRGVHVLGHPHLRALLGRKAELAAAREPVRRLLADRFGPFATLVVFASEPFRALKSAGALFADIAYDEVAIFRMVKEALALSGLGEALLVAKLHPKERLEDFAPHHGAVIKDEVRNYDLLAAADLVVGLKGMFLIEGVLFGRKVYSLDLHPNPDERLVTNALGLSRAARDARGLADLLRESPRHAAPDEDRAREALGLADEGFGPYLELMDAAEAAGAGTGAGAGA